jgi:CRP-like cAMP-binding protein
MVSINLFNRSDQIRLVPALTVIFEQGSPGRSMYAVIEGAVNILVNGTVVETVGPGGIFGEMSLIDPSEPRSASAVTAYATRLAEVDEAYFGQLVVQNPYFAIQIMQVVVERLRRMNKILEGQNP